MSIKILVEGWRFIPQSYAIVNQFQCLEFLKRPEIEIFHKDMPFPYEFWKPVTGLLDTCQEEVLRNISAPQVNQPTDITFRIFNPFNFCSSSDGRTYVFITSEYGCIEPSALNLAGYASFKEAHENSDIVLITPSEWSKQGLIQFGAVADRIRVIPHGFDPHIFNILPSEERTTLRKKLGWEDHFVFLQIGAMTGNKSIDLLLKAFAAVVEKYPKARLALKGLDSMYFSSDNLLNASETLTESEAERVFENIVYLGDSMSFVEIAHLYQAADAYVSPYEAEGFNIPVLEAIACGLPVICTRGGATDDFTHPDFTLSIESRPVYVTFESGNIGMGLEPNYDHLVTLMTDLIEQPDFIAHARYAGPQFVANQFTWQHVVDRLIKVFS